MTSTKGGVIKKVPRKKEPEPEKTEDDIVYEYIDKLKKHIEEKELGFFVYFTDTGVSEKLKDTSLSEVKEIMKKSPKKYVGRTIVSIVVKVTLPGKQRLEMKQGILIFCDIFTGKINDKGTIDRSTIAHISMCWEKNDLGLSKFSLKLIERMAKLIIKHEIKHVDLFGVPFDKMVAYFKHLNLDISKYFNPLPGITYKKRRSVYD